tara:strand:+ start:1390 stop:1812 length:423 start_codon:yes stop_codon:yes gene_type:complete
MEEYKIWRNTYRLISRELHLKIGSWNESLLTNQDVEFFCKVQLQASKIIYCKTILVYYRVNLSSITQSKKTIEKLSSELASYKLYETHLGEKLLTEEAKRAIGYNYLKFIYHNDSNNKDLTKIAWSYFYSLNLGKPWGVG